MTYLFAQADVCRLPLPDRSVDLVIGSPPYMDARTYGIGAQRDAHEWVAWMLDVSRECLRVSRGAVIWIAAGVTRDRNYWPGVEGLMWEWFKLGGDCHQYRPCYWHRVGIPGSGGDQWYRADVEYAVCFKRPGSLPYADPTANGKPPKWAPGGAMSYRNQSGSRKDRGEARAAAVASGGDSKMSVRETSRGSGNDNRKSWNYLPPALANPGNLIKVSVGGGKLGHDAASENEAPYPEVVPEFFIRSHCPPGGICLDPFSGSGTTVATATRLGRVGIGFDIRRSQAELGRRRVERPHAPVPKSSRPKDAPLALFGEDAL